MAVFVLKIGHGRIRRSTMHELFCCWWSSHLVLFARHVAQSFTLTAITVAEKTQLFELLVKGAGSMCVLEGHSWTVAMRGCRTCKGYTLPAVICEEKTKLLRKSQWTVRCGSIGFSAHIADVSIPF